MLFLAESFLPVLGGGEQHIALLASRLCALGVTPTVVARRTDAAWPERETLGGARVVRVPPSGRGRGGKYRMVPAAVRAVDALAPEHDLVVVRGTRVLGLPGLRAARRAALPVVLQPEVNGEIDGQVYLWGTALDRAPVRALVQGAVRLRNRMLRGAEAWVAMSRLIRDEGLAAGLPADRVHLIPHGVDTRRFHPASAEERAALRQRLGLPPSAVVVAYSGRLLRGKGLEHLVDAFAMLDASVPMHLLLVGSGDGQPLSIEPALRQRVADAGLGARVTFTGRVTAVEDWVRASDVFAFPSLFEGLGLSLVESAACGVPAVGSRTGGIVDVIEDGRSGFLVPPGDPRALAQHLRLLVDDPDRRTAMGEAARAVACARFDVDRMVARYVELFTSLVARPRPS